MIDYESLILKFVTKTSLFVKASSVHGSAAIPLRVYLMLLRVLRERQLIHPRHHLVALAQRISPALLNLRDEVLVDCISRIDIRE